MENKSYESDATYTETKFCGILPEDMMPAQLGTSSGTALVYNCGTVPCDTHISLTTAAVTTLTITNETNGSRCKLEELPAGSKFHIDSRYGRVYRDVTGTEVDAFEHHDLGYITLDSCGTYWKDIWARTIRGTGQVELIDEDVTDEMIGKYMYLNGTWYEIQDIAANGRLVL